MIRVALPPPLRSLAKIDGELKLAVAGPATPNAIIDVIEAEYPVLKGLIRDHHTQKRRPFVRFFACGEDFSHQSPDAPLPDTVARGVEPFLIVGAIAGG